MATCAYPFAHVRCCYCGERADSYLHTLDGKACPRCYKARYVDPAKTPLEIEHDLLTHGTISRRETAIPNRRDFTVVAVRERITERTITLANERVLVGVA